MKRIIIDYKKLTPDILDLLVAKFPDGYGDRDIIVFDNHKNETIEAVQVETQDAIYLVKVGSKLHYSMLNHDSIEEKDPLASNPNTIVEPLDLKEDEEKQL